MWLLLPQAMGLGPNERKDYWDVFTSTPGSLAAVSETKRYMTVTTDRHTFELPESTSTEVLICYKNRGVGSTSSGPHLVQQYRVKDDTIDFSFSVQ